MIKIEVFENENLVGELILLDRNSYSFNYHNSWLESNNAFAIDPQLPLSNQVYYNKELWGAFSDIAPDRWGRLIQSRSAGKLLSDSEYMLGVSDYFRVGALRLKINGEFVSKSKDIPKLLHLNQIQDSTLRLESDEYTKEDLTMLLSPSSSLGGARPKASVEDNNKLYIAKFYSKNDLYSIILWEAVMLELSKRAKIHTSSYKIIKSNQKAILLVERFDRDKGIRIPFMSAMTLLSARDSNKDKSYIDIASKLDSSNKQELFKRMLFNALFGNTDDHLRNHGLLYDKHKKVWNLSPAYDLNPTPYEYSKQHHALNFINLKDLPSIELCRDIAVEFNVSDKEFLIILSNCIKAGEQYRNIALSFGIKQNEINLFKQNFEHNEILKAKELLKSLNLDKTKQNTKIKQKSKSRGYER